MNAILNQQDFSFLLENSHDLIYIKNKEHRFTNCSQSFAQIIGLNHRQDIKGKTVFDLFPKDIADQYHKTEEDIFTTGKTLHHIESYYDCQDNLRWLSSNKSPIFDNYGKVTGLINISHDISHLEKGEAIIQQINEDDLLTAGLPNRKRLHRLCTKEIQTAKLAGHKLAVILININQFHYINTIYGYSIGDQILIKLKNKINRLLPINCIFSRIEGDKFVTLYPFDEPHQLENTIEQILFAFSEPFSIGKERIELSARIGVSVYPDYGDNGDDLISSAETAINQSKESKENILFFSKNLEKNLHRRRFIVQQMKQALDQGEFYMVYQPILDLKTRQVIAVESLVRWKSPILGDIYPDEFISIAESTGFIFQLGHWIRKRAVEEFSEIKKLPAFIHSNLYMTINIAASELTQTTLKNNLLTLLKSYSLSTSDVMLELTERTILDDIPNIGAILSEFFEQDIQLVIDDFGTRYSTLNYIIQYPFATLKMDKEFIANVTESQKAIIVFKKVIELTKALNIKLIAEGIETEEQLQFLNQIECSYGQGYHLGRPATLDIIKNTFG